VLIAYKDVVASNAQRAAAIARAIAIFPGRTHLRETKEQP